MPELKVFVATGCRVCRYSLELAEQVRAQFPTLRVEVVNLSDPAAERPEAVFAVPTYLLDGSVLALGNPHPATLMHQLAVYLSAQERARELPRAGDRPAVPVRFTDLVAGAPAECG